MIREKRPLGDAEKRLPRVYESLRQRDCVETLYLSGSLAVGKRTPLSDVDLAVLSNPKLNRDELFEHELELRALIERRLAIEEFELVILNRSPDRFAWQVRREGKLIFCKHWATLIEFMDGATMRTLDFAPFRRQFLNAHLAEMRQDG